MKSEILNDILVVVSSVCEIPADEILSKCKRNDVVDARCIFVYYCNKFGFKASEVTRFLNRKRLCFFNDCLRNFESFSQQSLSFRLLCHDVNRMLTNKYPSSQR